MSLVIDLICQLNCHVIGCKTRKSCLVRFDPSIVRSVYCLSDCQFSLLFVCFGVGKTLVLNKRLGYH